jgi:hypothetical protein
MRRALPILVFLAGCATAPPTAPAPTEGLISLIVDISGME